MSRSDAKPEKPREQPSLEQRLARLQRVGDASYLEASWENYYTLRFREVCAIVKALFDPAGTATRTDVSITVLEYGCSAGPLFRALDHNLGSLFRFTFVGIESDWRAGGFLCAKLPATHVHMADLIRLEELAAEGSMRADVCVALSQCYGMSEDAARRLVNALSAIAPRLIVADQIDNVSGTSAQLLDLTDHAGRSYQAVCHPFTRLLADAGYRESASFPAAEPYKSISGYVVGTRADTLPSSAIAAALQQAITLPSEPPLLRPVPFGPVLSGFLRARKLACMDVGAAGGVHPLWQPYGEFIEVDAFEPNAEACRKAAAESEPFVTWHPVALGAATGTQKFYALKAPTGSSFYPPNDAVQQFFNDSSYRGIDRVVDVETVSIADFLRQSGRPAPNVIKLDTQGSELDILRSIGDEQWRDVLAIETEVEFVELYTKQPLFGDVDAFLRSKGMVLFDLRTAREYCAAHDEAAYYVKKYFGGRVARNDVSARLYAGDALYIRDAFAEPPASRESLLKLVAVLLMYLYVDYAIYFCDVGVQRGLLDAGERDALVAEIVAAAPAPRPLEPVYQAFWQVRNWPNQ